MYSVADETRKPIFEGVQGENEARSIEFDITPWVEELGNGACTATAKRPTDTTPYPVTVTRSGNVVTWKPDSTDTAIEGLGAFQLSFSIDDVVAKTRIWNTKIAPSLVGAGDPPDPYDDWLQDLRDIAADALQDAQDADASAQDAEAWAKGTKNGTPVPSTADQYENNAKYYAEQSLANQYGAYIVKSASGEIASFSDGADDVPMKSCVLQINSQQDLNGYDKPWPAGGSVNMLNTATQESGYINASGEVVTDGGISQHSALIPVTVGNQYTFSGVTSGVGNKRVHGYNSNGVWVQQLDFAYTASVGEAYSVTVTIPSGIAYMKVSYMDLDKRKQVESGATVTEYRPYANICPINGWQDIDIYDDPTYGGTVKFNQLLQDTNFNGGSIPSSMTKTYNASTDTLSVSATIPSAGYGYVGKYFESVAGHYYAISFRASATNVTSLWAKASADTSYTPGATYTGEKVYTVIQQVTEASLNALLGFSAPNGTNVTISFSKANIIDLTEMFGAGNEPQTAEQLRDILPLDYYAYNAGTKTNVSAVNGTPYRVTTVQLGQTVYGGVVNPISGELVIDRAIVQVTSAMISGASAYAYSGKNGVSFTAFPVNVDKYTGSLKGLANVSTIEAGAVAKDQYMRFGSANGNKVVYWIGILDVLGMTLDEWKTWANEQTIQLVYPLTTPTTVQLTPAQVATLLGQNNVWSDAGSVAVEYRADPTLAYAELQALILENL